MGSYNYWAWLYWASDDISTTHTTFKSMLMVHPATISCPSFILFSGLYTLFPNIVRPCNTIFKFHKEIKERNVVNGAGEAKKQALTRLVTHIFFLSRGRRQWCGWFKDQTVIFPRERNLWSSRLVLKKYFKVPKFRHNKESMEENLRWFEYGKLENEGPERQWRGK